MEKKVSIPVGEKEAVTGIVSAKDPNTQQRIGVILAHGAGNDMNNPLLVSLAGGIADAGHISLRFNFPYKEKGRKAPDSQNKLVATWQAVYGYLKHRAERRPHKIIVAGKSMGGRVASQMVSAGLLDAGGLILYGYPLHPPGNKKKLRDGHLYAVKVPMLFFAGTRDPLCDVSLLKVVLGRLPAPWSLHTVEGGDHSFKVPKSSPVLQEEVYAQILQKTLSWLAKND